MKIFQGLLMIRGLMLAAAMLTAVPAFAQSLPTKGANQYTAIAPNNSDGVSIKASAGVITGIQVGGIGSAPAYLKLYDKATAATCGTDTPKKVILIPAAATAALGSMTAIDAPVGIKFTLGISYCVVTGIANNNTTAPAASTFLINLDYN